MTLGAEKQRRFRAAVSLGARRGDDALVGESRRRENYVLESLRSTKRHVSKVRRWRAPPCRTSVDITCELHQSFISSSWFIVWFLKL